MSEQDATAQAQALEIEKLAIKFHHDVDGEYGCPGPTCPRVQELVKFAESAAALRALPRAGQWQPIATAKRHDGERVLLYWETRGACSGYWHVDEDDAEEYGWRGDEDLCIPRDQYRCTHWMPLPDAPDSAAAPRAGQETTVSHDTINQLFRCPTCGTANYQPNERCDSHGQLEHQHSGCRQSSQPEQSEGRGPASARVCEATESGGAHDRSGDVHARREGFDPAGRSAERATDPLDAAKESTRPLWEAELALDGVRAAAPRAGQDVTALLRRAEDAERELAQIRADYTAFAARVSDSLAAPRAEQEETALVEIARHLTPDNQNVIDGDLIACIRDLAQIALTNQGLVEEYEARAAAPRAGEPPPQDQRCTCLHLQVQHTPWGDCSVCGCSCYVPSLAPPPGDATPPLDVCPDCGSPRKLINGRWVSSWISCERPDDALAPGDAGPATGEHND